MLYILDHFLKVQRQKHFAEQLAARAEAQARTNAAYYTQVKAEAELAQKRLIAEQEEQQRKLAVGMAKIEREFQERQAQMDAQSESSHEARLRRDIATIRELTTPVSQPAYNYANPMSAERMAAQGMHPRFWSPAPRSAPASIPQDLEIEERGNWWYGSDGSSGHIRVRPGGGKVYETTK